VEILLSPTPQPNVWPKSHSVSVSAEYQAVIFAEYSVSAECGHKQNTCTKGTALLINCGYFFRPHSNLTTCNIFHNIHLTQRTFQSESVVEIK